MKRLDYVRHRDSLHCEIAPLIVAGAIAAGSALASGALNRGPTEAQQRRQAYDQYEAEFRAKMDMARRYGLSPLVTVGTPGSFTATPSQSPYVDLGPAAELFGRHFEGKAKASSDAEIDAKTARRLALTRGQLENQKLAGEVREGDMRRVAMWNEMLKDAQAANAQPTLPPLWIEVMDDDGKVQKVLNPELSQSFSEGAGWMTSSKWGRDLFGGAKVPSVSYPSLPELFGSPLRGPR